MGLDVSHDAWHGAYSAFSRWRTALSRAAGGDMWGTEPGKAYYTYERDNFTPEQESGFRELMGHSDCDGEIPPNMCLHVADALEVLLPRMTSATPESAGHIEHQGGNYAVTKRFIEGCRAAYESGEALRFE